MSQIKRDIYQLDLKIFDLHFDHRSTTSTQVSENSNQIAWRVQRETHQRERDSARK